MPTETQLTKAAEFAEGAVMLNEDFTLYEVNADDPDDSYATYVTHAADSRHIWLDYALWLYSDKRDRIVVFRTFSEQSDNPPYCDTENIVATYHLPNEWDKWDVANIILNDLSLR